MVIGKYLPPEFEDFHAQKDLFRAIHDVIAVDRKEYVKGVDWVTGHVYTIDVFLWFMAQHGWKLQKDRRRLKFNNINETVRGMKERRQKAFREMLSVGDKKPNAVA